MKWSRVGESGLNSSAWVQISFGFFSPLPMKFPEKSVGDSQFYQHCFGKITVKSVIPWWLKENIRGPRSPCSHIRCWWISRSTSRCQIRNLSEKLDASMAGDADFSGPEAVQGSEVVSLFFFGNLAFFYFGAHKQHVGAFEDNVFGS